LQPRARRHHARAIERRSRRSVTILANGIPQASIPQASGHRGRLADELTHGDLMHSQDNAEAVDGQMLVDLELLKKYNVAGPRYTSYPTALHFDESVDASVVPDRLSAQLDRSRPLSLYFHLPFCRSLCWYCACTKIITGDRSQSARYMELLEREIELKAPLTDGRPVVQIHLGGGTPTFASAEELARFGELLEERFQIDDRAEISIEIDPREFSAEKAHVLAQAGFNRASLGIQDSNPEVQRAVNRIQPMSLNRQVVSWLGAAGIDSVNVDLIYGLPHQTLASFEETLDEVLELDPDRFAIYSYAHVPWVNAAQKHLERTGLPSADLKLRLLKLVIERLSQAGYDYIGMDHFAKPDDELAVARRQGRLQRNFQGYSTWGGVEIMGYGMSSISQSRDMYFQNYKDLPDYEDAIDRGQWPTFRGVILEADDHIRRRTIMEVMCRAEVDFESLSDQLDIDFAEYFGPELGSLDALDADGLVRRAEQRLEITATGRLFIRNIAMQFDHYLAQKGPRTYSKTV
jgi:oxygen-independent coproporphyrinogen III oxidase